MEFCPKCSGIIDVKDARAVCMACGYKPQKKLKIEASEKINKREIVAVIKEDAENVSYPVVQAKCPKCKNKEAYFWTQQTRAADESETKFYKCIKCKHTWREYR